MVRTNNEKQLIHLTGEVEDTRFSNAETGYIVLDMDINNELVTAVGEMGDVRAGETLSMYGEFVNHSKYGKQFRVEIFERTLPTDLNSIRKYLGSGVITGIGPSIAKKITGVFGDRSLDIIENDPMQLVAISGITADRAKKIGDDFRKISGLRKVMTFFSKYSVSHYVISAAWKSYGTDLIRAVESNPYCLCVPEIGLEFNDAERIAGDLNFPMDSEERVYAGIIRTLNEKVNEGSCCIRESELAADVTQRLVVNDKLYYSALQFAEKRGDIVDSNIYDAHYIYLKPYFDAETFISEKVSEMVKLDGERFDDYSNEISIIADEQGIEYEEHQTAAINACMNNHVFILTGGPGTGKTTTLKAVIELYRKRKVKFKLAAPTGRAAKRMSDLTGAPAQTIHRLLEVDFTANGNTFKHNEENPLSCRALIVDELSMVDTLLFASLLRAVKSNTNLILVGDSNQLPSVGAGNVLRDLLESGVVPSLELTEIFRQASESLIVTNAHAIIQGKLPELDDRTNDFFYMESNNENVTADLVCSLCKTRLPDAYKYDPMDDIQVLCPLKVGGEGTENLNRRLQETLNPPDLYKGEMRLFNTVLRAGDKIMQTKNDYDIEWRRGNEKSHGIYNGDIGKIISVDQVNQKCVIDFEGRIAEYNAEMLRKVEHAYAITVHKSQGSEYPAVIIPLYSGMDRLSFRNLLYTAVTRAREKLIIIGTRNKIEAMVKNDIKAERFTCLRSMLEDKFAE